MQLAVNSGYFRHRRGGQPSRDHIECARICRDAGFRIIDFSFAATDTSNPLHNDDWEAEINRLAVGFADAGVTVEQSHAPFVRSAYDRPTFIELIRRSIDASATLGVRHIVVHADTYDKSGDGYDPPQALREIHDFLAPFVEQAKKRGVGIAIENLFEPRANAGRSRFTSTLEEQLAIISRFNDPAVTACWDFGHGRIVHGDKQLDALQQVGHHLSCTHVHDNIFSADLHQLPYFGGTDWEAVMTYLKRSGYTGNCTLELVYGRMPDELMPAYAAVSHQIGMHLVRLFERA